MGVAFSGKAFSENKYNHVTVLQDGYDDVFKIDWSTESKLEFICHEFGLDQHQFRLDHQEVA